METKSHSLGGIRTLTLLGIGVLLPWLATDSNSRENQIQPRDEQQQTAEIRYDSRTRISAEEIRLDAVVLDQKGHQIIDLTSDDFEIYQDKKKQQITSCTYINHDSDSLKTSNDARRRIVFFVDNFSMNAVQVHRTQQFLQQFVQTQMQQEDLVAILETLRGNSPLQMLSSDKQFLLSAIDKLQWSMDLRTIENKGSAMSLLMQCIQALKDKPGRKSLIAISAEAMLLGSSSGSAGSFTISPAAMENKNSPFGYNPLADAAFRAGVVIHLLDISGLSGPDAPDRVFTAEHGSGRLSPEEQAKMVSKAIARSNAQSQIHLAEKTGGLFIRDSNLAPNGNASITEVLKGYYMLTYIPAPGTFILPHDAKASNLPYHKIKIKVKRPVDEVLTRDGFFGAPEREN
jgi:VWFA-related protein